MTKNDCKDMPIEELDLWVRVYNSLRRQNIYTVGQILDILHSGRPEINLLRLGEAGLRQILENLERLNCFPDDLPLDIDVRTQDKRIQWLINSQLENGSWYDDIDITIAAVLSVIRSNQDLLEINLQNGIYWVKQRMSQIDDEILSYALQRMLAEYTSAHIPVPSFDLKFTEKPFYRANLAGNLDELRRVALIRGNAVKVYPYADYPGDKLGHTYTHTEIMWMTVGEPKNEK